MIFNNEQNEHSKYRFEQWCSKTASLTSEKISQESLGSCLPGSVLNMQKIILGTHQNIMNSILFLF